MRRDIDQSVLKEKARTLEGVLSDFGIRGEIVAIRPGPVVTLYELEPDAGIRASRIIGLSDDIARNMSALSARVAVVPGRTVLGIELPNDDREMVVLRELLETRAFGKPDIKLPIALGSRYPERRWSRILPTCPICWLPEPPGPASRWQSMP